MVMADTCICCGEPTEWKNSIYCRSCREKSTPLLKVFPARVGGKYANRYSGNLVWGYTYVPSRSRFPDRWKYNVFGHGAHSHIRCRECGRRYPIGQMRSSELCDTCQQKHDARQAPFDPRKYVEELREANIKYHRDQISWGLAEI